MKTLFKLTTLLFIASFIGCSSISYHNDYDPSIDFARYKTYQWYSGDHVEGDALVGYPLVQKRLINSVDRVLTEKGYTEIKEGEADFVVILHAGLKEHTKMNTYGYGGYGYGRYGYGWSGTGGMATTDVITYDEATLVIDIANVLNKELVWRGTATGIVGSPEDDQAKAQAKADDVVGNILSTFPPEKE